MEASTKKYVDDTDAARLSDAQTIAGINTFSASPIVPTPTTDYQAATKKYNDDNKAISSIEDYGTSGTTGTVKDNGDIIFCYGARAVGSGSSATVTGLPFSSTTSYKVTITMTGTVAHSSLLRVVQNSASQFIIYNVNDGPNLDINWIAIGT